MKIAWLITILTLFVTIYGEYEESELIIAELQVADLELQDDCNNLAAAIKTSLVENTFNEVIDALKSHGHLLRSQSINLKKYENIPFFLERNLTTIVNSGDTALPDKDWFNLISYYVRNWELTHITKNHCKTEPGNCPLIKTGYEDILEHSKNETVLKKAWGTWQTLFTLRRTKFLNILKLVRKAAIENGQNDPQTYWEMLIEQEDAYEKADAMWNEIQPLYFKLHNFVKKRIFNYFDMKSNNSLIPVYLLGSNFGYDWSYIADKVLPNSSILDVAKKYIKRTTIKKIYELAERLTKELSLGSLGNDFWKNSLFNMTFCENYVLSFCSEEYSELLTCQKSSLVTYIDAFEVAADVTLRNVDYLTLPRFNLRYSVIDEAIKSLSSVLAVTRMRHNGLLDGVPFNKQTELILIALRILPKLPFYLMADKWRLEMLKSGFQNLNLSWWKFRKTFQGVEGISNDELDYLGESYIISNRPYLSKFFGTILQFQLLEHYQLQQFDSGENIAMFIGNDDNFLSMIHQKSSDNWQSLVSTYYGITDLTARSLLDYFQPLEEYLENSDKEQQEVTTKISPSKKESDKLLKKTVIKRRKEEINQSVASDVLAGNNKVVDNYHVINAQEDSSSASSHTGTHIGAEVLVVAATLFVKFG